MRGKLLTALVAGGAILLTGCGGGDERPASTESASSASVSGSPSATSASATATTSLSPTPSDTQNQAGQPDQTGVGTTWILLTGKGPFAVLQSRTREPDGRIRVTWAVTADTVNEWCLRYGLCTGGPDNYINNDPATSWAIADCSAGTLVRPWGTDPAGSEQTLRRLDDNSWQDVATGNVLDSSNAGGGAVAESMWNAACNPTVDPYSTNVDWSTADQRNCPVGRLEVATTDRWYVCLSPQASLSEGFASNIANAVSAEGQYSDVPSPNGKTYYFTCQWQDLGQAGVGLRTLRCGLPPTDIVGGGVVDLVPVA